MNPVSAACRLFGLAALAILASATGSRAAESVRRYPLWYAPLCVLRSASTDELSRLRAYPHTFALTQAAPSYWQRLPALAPFDMQALWGALTQAKARDLRYVVLPPAAPLCHAIWMARIPGLKTRTQALAFLQRAGLADPHQVAYALHRGMLHVASSQEILAAYTSPDSRRQPLPDAKWPQSLETALAAPTATLDAWVDLPWTLNAVSMLTGVHVSERLQLGAVDVPPALRLRVTPRDKEIELEAAIHQARPARPPSEPLPSTRLLAQALPPEAEIRFSVYLDVLRRASGKRSLWQALIHVLAVPEPAAAMDLDSTVDQLRLLTGLHPDRHGLALLDETAAFGLWRDPEGKRLWAFLTGVRRPELLERSLRRALAWARFFAEQDHTPLTVETLDVPGALLARHVRGAGVALAFALDRETLLIARTPRALAQVRARLAGLKPGPASDTWLTWNLQLSAQTTARFTPGLGSLALLALFLQPEHGNLSGGHGRLSLRDQGGSTPLGLTLVGAFLGGELLALTATDPADEATGWLRLFLEAQQTYRHMGLGPPIQGQPAFAKSLYALVQGNGPNGHSLRAFYNRLYDFTDRGYTFAQMARVRAVPGYTFVTARRRGGKPLDLRREWALVAAPRDVLRHAALIIDQNGHVYTRRITEEERNGLIDLPVDWAAAGWKRR